MLKIEILDGNPATGALQFSVNGVPSTTGDGEVKGLWKVKWEVKSNPNVAYITDIRMRNGVPGNTNIFKIDRPKKEDSSRKKWGAWVDPFPRKDAEYTYDIEWMPTSLGAKPVVCDPKISIMPGFVDKDLARYALVAAGAAALAALIYVSLRSKTRAARHR
jgi:hypothetical protein